MKKLFLGLSLGLALTAAAGVLDEKKVAVVDMLVLIRNHPNAEANKTLLTTTDKDYQKKLDVIKSEGEKLQEEGKQLSEQMRNPMILDKAKAETEGKLMELQKKLMTVEQRYRSEAMRFRQDLQELEARLLKTTTEDIRKRLKAFAGKGGYDLILDSTAAPFAKADFDVTDAVLTEMGVDLKDVKGRDEGK